MELREIAKNLYEAVVEAGEHALRVQISPRTWNSKEPLDVDSRGVDSALVTSAVDDNVLRFLHAKIESIAPFDGYWEEVGSDRHPGGRYWSVGKVDGAVNFTRNLAEWTLTVSLFELNETGQAYPILGIVHAPALQTTYLAARKQGAIRIRPSKVGLKREPVVPSMTQNLRGSVVSFGMSYFPEESKQAIATVASMAGLPADIKRMGPTSLDLCKVADGTYDAYFEPSLHNWDIPAVSAGSIVVWESGASLRQWDGSEIDWYQKNNILATNGLLTDELQTYLAL